MKHSLSRILVSFLGLSLFILLAVGCGDNEVEVGKLNKDEIAKKEQIADLLVKEFTEGYAETSERMEAIEIRDVHYVISSDGDIWFYWSTYSSYYGRYNKHFYIKCQKLGHITIATHGRHGDGYSLTISSAPGKKAIYSGSIRGELLPVDSITFGHYKHAHAIKLKKLIQSLK